MTSLLEVNSVTKQYQGVKAVENLSFVVKPGECVALLGANGAGKTTTCEMVEGLIAQDEGQISILGMSYQSHRAEILEKLGVHLQDTRLYKKLTVVETLNLFASFYKTSWDIANLMQLLSVTDLAHKRIEHLSGGQVQRLYIACALVNKPQLLILDEPSLGLDPQVRQSLWAVLQGIKHSCGILLTTHYMEEAEHLADRIVVLDRGKKIAEGTTRELGKIFQVSEILCFGGSEQQLGVLTRELERWQLPFVTSAQGIELRAESALSTLKRILSIPGLDERGLALTIRRATLEDIFLRLVGDPS